jgi:hypothetical protein
MDQSTVFCFCPDYCHPENEVSAAYFKSVNKNVKLTNSMLRNFEPSEDLILFKSGDIIQRLIFYHKDSQWDALELRHLTAFRAYVSNTFGQRSGVPCDYPEPEIIRMLHATGWNYNRAYLDIVN